MLEEISIEDEETCHSTTGDRKRRDPENGYLKHHRDQTQSSVGQQDGEDGGVDGDSVEHSRRRMVLANVCTVVLYTCFLGACVMTSVESVKSVIRASTTPVSSTSIHFQQEKYNPPAIILLYVADSDEKSLKLRDYHCVCRYSNNGGLTDIFARTLLGSHLTSSRRRCEYVTDIISIEDFYAVMAAQPLSTSLDPRANISTLLMQQLQKHSQIRANRSKKHEKHYVAFTIRGPEDWERKEQVEVACNHRNNYGSSTSSGTARTSAQFEKTDTSKTPDYVKSNTPLQNSSSKSSTEKNTVDSNVQRRNSLSENFKTELSDPVNDTGQVRSYQRHTRQVSEDAASAHIGFQKLLNISSSRRRAQSFNSGKKVREDDKVRLEYMLLPSYHEMLKHENRMQAILTHRGTKETAFTESSVSKTLHVYLLMSEVEEQGQHRSLLDTEESYKIAPVSINGGELGNVKLKFEWKSPMVWKIKTFIAASPWYAVTVICTMLLTLAEAVNVSRNIKFLFLGRRRQTNQTSRIEQQRQNVLMHKTGNVSNDCNDTDSIVEISAAPIDQNTTSTQNCVEISSNIHNRCLEKSYSTLLFRWCFGGRKDRGQAFLQTKARPFTRIRRLDGARQSDEDAGQSYSLHYVVTDPGFQQNAVILTAEKNTSKTEENGHQEKSGKESEIDDDEERRMKRRPFHVETHFWNKSK
ncbi:uncharacterized protein LOC134841584 [Symsagittifera roscoffensis]|uniref:uncharacterized protein LOC134841584 n=1 Tax=Symsagittifera roscoffensis TaxID=84072 RepID=UPI00307B9737